LILYSTRNFETEKAYFIVCHDRKLLGLHKCLRWSTIHLHDETFPRGEKLGRLVDYPSKPDRELWIEQRPYIAPKHFLVLA
jgi:predicted DNA-binding transcriptional regulator AlpA